MSQYAQKGYDANNVVCQLGTLSLQYTKFQLFSPCSRKLIRDVLIGKWESCFQEEMTSFCGNGIVEDGEECDNGVDTDNGKNCFN